mgnify:CR=1 FL=1
MEFRFFEIYRSNEFLLLLMQGAKTSLVLTVIAGIFGFIFAAALAASRYFKIPVLRYFSLCFIELTRNTPLIVQLFFFAFGLPLLLGYQWPFWAHALLAITLNFSAYFSEILRAGFQEIDNGQKEAEENYKDGKRDGLWTEWYENGQKKLEDNYKDGEWHGLCTEWYDNGQKE